MDKVKSIIIKILIGIGAAVGLFYLFLFLTRG